ncbi:uncharacterized protein LOC144205606 [Stigmatopora nigra]
MKWYELLQPLCDPLEDKRNQSDAHSPYPPTPIDTQAVLKRHPNSWSPDSFICGDHVKNTDSKMRLQQGHVQPSHLKADDATNQHQPCEWPFIDLDLEASILLNPHFCSEMEQTCVEEMKWHELLMPIYEPLEDPGYLSNACPPPASTPIDPTSVPLDPQAAFTGHPCSWSFDSCIWGDNVLNMGYKMPLQSTHLNVGPAGDATNQSMNNQPLPPEWPVNEPNASTTFTTNQHLPYECPGNEVNAPTPLCMNNQHLPLEWPVNEPNAAIPLVTKHFLFSRKMMCQIFTYSTIEGHFTSPPSDELEMCAEAMGELICTFQLSIMSVS